MTPEGAVKRDVKKVLEAAGVWYFMPVSNGMGRHGIPDFICCVDGQFLAIETKAGKGKTTALQERELETIRAKGGVALVVREDGIDTLRARINEIKENAHD
jgi:Holliday junction resolvase